MKANCCQRAAPGRDNVSVSRPASRWRRAGGAAGWIVPGITLALVPKCPVCLAAYVAVATGIGVSLPVAALLRTTLLIGCVTALVLVAGSQLRAFWRRRIGQHRKVDAEAGGKM
jgi:hypothetical protein